MNQLINEMASLRSHENEKMTLSSTDEFWFSSLLANAASTNDESDDDDSYEYDLSMPPAHHQLLSSEHSTFERLMGHDHTLAHHEESFPCRPKLSDVKERGGGSWLLGFARLSVDDADDASEDTLPDLIRENASLDPDDSSSCSDDDASASSCPPRKRSGVTFSETVTVRPVPHSSDLTHMQRRRLYASSFEVRQNKIRNKKEYRYDGNDWRNATEERDMGVDMVTGELVHPAHEW